MSGAREYRYAAFMSGEAEPAPEHIAEYERRGWTYVTTLNKQFHIWKSEQMAAFLDPAPGMEAEDFARLRRRLYVINILLLLALLGFAAVLVSMVLRSPTPLWSTI